MTDPLSDFDALWDYNDPAETERRLCDILPAAEQSGNISYHLQLLTQIARALGLQRKFEAAHAVLDTVQAGIAENETVEVRYLLERGRVFNSSGSKAEALPLFEQAWTLGCATGLDGFAVDAAHMVAIAAPTPEEALAWNLKALELAQASSEPRAQKWLGSLYNNIGWTVHDMGDYAKALEIFQQALAWREQQGQTEPIRIARWCVGRALRSLGRVEEALSLQQALLKEYETAGEKATFTYEEIAECLLSLGREAEARPYFTLAYEQLSQIDWLAADEPKRLARLQRLSHNIG